MLACTVVKANRMQTIRVNYGKIVVESMSRIRASTTCSVSQLYAKTKGLKCGSTEMSPCPTLKEVRGGRITKSARWTHLDTMQVGEPVSLHYAPAAHHCRVRAVLASIARVLVSPDALMTTAKASWSFGVVRGFVTQELVHDRIDTVHETCQIVSLRDASAKSKGRLLDIDVP
jgi:hypothetical protein